MISNPTIYTQTNSIVVNVVTRCFRRQRQSNYNKWIKLTKAIASTALITFFMIGCKKFVEIDPPVTQTTGESVFNENSTAIAAINGIYSLISRSGTNDIFSFLSISKRAGLSSDELTLWSGAGNNDIAYYLNSLAENGVVSVGHELWNTCYNYIFTCNSAIEGLSKTTALTPSVKQQLLGEAKFMRAFFNFYLVNLYGDIPLALSTDYKVNRILPRAPRAEVYQSIIQDLKDAQTLLSSIFLDGQLKEYSNSQERVRPTQWAATALLARVYLYTGNYVEAENQASAIISNSNLFSLSDLSNAFLKASLGNKEAIFQLQPVIKVGGAFLNTWDGRLFLLSSPPVGLNSLHVVSLSPQLLAAFDSTDNRKKNWVGSYTDGTGTYYFSSKYKLGGLSSSPTEYLMVLRLGEQYLIRAEARAQQNKINEAQSDLNVIRNRAGLGNTTANDKTSLLTAILHEKQVELFTEWGHRWFDLKRTGNVDLVMPAVTAQKAANWNVNVSWKTNWQWYPIQLEEIQEDPNLIQNTGY